MRERRVLLGVALAVVAVLGVVAPAAAVSADADESATAGAGATAGSGALAASSANPAAASGAATVDCSYPMTVTDASGTEVTIDDVPERVVVAGASAAQTMWAMGVQDKVVGMPNNYATAYLDGREGIPNVVNARLQPVQEKIVDGDPDLVLAPNIIQNDTVASMRDAGLTVYRFHEATSLDDVYAKTKLTGRLVGAFESSARVSARMRAQVSAVREAVADEEPKKVFYNLGGGWTVRPDTFIGDVIATAGGENIAEGRLERRYAPLPSEEILVEDPEWILTTTGLPLPKNTGINESTAVEQNQIVTVNTNFLNQPGPRNVEPLVALASALHPDAMADVNVSNVEPAEPDRCLDTVSTATPSDDATPTPSDGATATPSDGATATPSDEGGATPTEPMSDATDEGGTETPGADPTTSSSDSGPGFTAASALVAALVGALLVRRRR